MQHLVQQLPKQHKVAISILVVLVLLLMVLPSEKANAYKDESVQALSDKIEQVEVVSPAISEQPASVPAKAKSEKENQENRLQVGKVYPLELDINALNHQQPEKAQQPDLKWKTVKVKNGDNLAILFQRAGFSAQTLYKVTSVGKQTKVLKKIHPGQTITFGSNKDGVLKALRYAPDAVSTLVVELKDSGKYAARTETKDVEVREKYAGAQITSNFWNAGIEAGLSEKQIMNLANIFGWDIDFANDIRQGDEFSVVFETRYIDGEYVNTGNILAAEFVNQGDAYQAVRYTDGEYYSPEGRSMRKAFLRAPVNFKYVSSNFKPRRFHPVLKRWKAHRGVDYAAKKGTPVVAAGNGKVIASAYNKYNGNYVFIEHPGGIVTKYLHFSKRKVKKGARVKQGQLIGLVGSTGLSSAPHLHFEFIVNGVHRNPRTVKMPKANPIAKKEKQKFLAIAKTKMHQLQSNKRLMLAMSQQ